MSAITGPARSVVRSAYWLCALSLLALAASSLGACTSEAGFAEPDTEQAPRGPRKTPRLIDVPAGTAVDGFAQGRLRRTADVGAFAITKHPVTVKQLEECVTAGACKRQPAGECEASLAQAYPGFELDAASAPAMCAGLRNAESYCKWIGGRLPTLVQWLYAARGIEPRRYAWGGDVAGCQHNPRVQKVVAPGEGGEGELVRMAACVEADGEKPRIDVGAHPDSASPFGVEDALLVSAELLRVDDKALLGACRPGFAACLVTSATPGSIDSARPIESNTESPSAFRCVIEEK